MINEVAQMREGRAGRFLFELFPAGETSTILDHEECVQGGSRLLRDGLIDPTVEAARRHGSDVVRRFVQRSKGREFKVFPGEFRQSDINHLGQILFGSGCLHHRFEQHEKAKLRDAAFGRTKRQKPFPRGRCIDLSQIFRSQAPLEAGIRCSFNRCHRTPFSNT
jgi:hypothetical protein